MVTAKRDRGTRYTWIYSIALGFNAFVLVAFIAGSMIFTGGQVAEGESTKWQPVWYWPVFPVPAWLLIVPAAVALVVVIPMCVLTPAAQATRLLGTLGPTGGAIAAEIIFMLMFPAEPLWIALAVTLVCVPVLIVGIVVKGIGYERLRKSGDLIL